MGKISRTAAEATAFVCRPLGMGSSVTCFKALIGNIALSSALQLESA